MEEIFNMDPNIFTVSSAQGMIDLIPQLKNGDIVYIRNTISYTKAYMFENGVFFLIDE